MVGSHSESCKGVKNLPAEQTVSVSADQSQLQVPCEFEDFLYSIL